LAGVLGLPAVMSKWGNLVSSSHTMVSAIVGTYSHWRCHFLSSRGVSPMSIRG
jgi:hypothetical protein